MDRDQVAAPPVRLRLNSCALRCQPGAGLRLLADGHPDGVGDKGVAEEVGTTGVLLKMARCGPSRDTSRSAFESATPCQSVLVDQGSGFRFALLAATVSVFLRLSVLQDWPRQFRPAG